MPIKIHGKEYITVSERVKDFLELVKDTEHSINTEILQHHPVVVVKATVTIGENVYTGISASYGTPDKPIEKKSPYEVAETSAVGRALGFAGFGSVDSIASADEIIKSGVKVADDDIF